MPMTGASMYWLDALHDCKLDQSLPLPYDRYRLSNEHRTGRGTRVSFNFGQDLSQHFLTYTSSNNLSLQHLTLAAYFIFLFKLTNGKQDLCIRMNINNRYRDELHSIIGMFVNVIPLRCQLDSHWSFHRLLEHVCTMITDSMKYSYFPLQRILSQHPHVSNPAFLDTSFEFVSSKTKDYKNDIIIGNTQLSSIPLSIIANDNEIMSEFDFSLSVLHDMSIDELSYTINASLDLFHVQTMDKITQQFHSMLHQLSASLDSQVKTPVYELSLILSDERSLMQSINHTQMLSFPSVTTCIHHEFASQVMKHPQKLAVELDDQSLAYAELLHYVQILSLHLLTNYHVIPGEVICQCVERSLSLVSCVKKICICC